jgi:hypothetical protein
VKQAKLDKLQGLLLTELQRRLEEAKEGFVETAQADDLEAYDLTLTWLMGLSPGKRPPREVVAKAFALRESFTPEMVDLARRVAIARGDLAPKGRQTV